MMKIRLAEYGSKNRRTFRVVAIDESSRRNGKPVEILGFYNPLVTPAQIKIDMERLNYWKSQGAQVTIGVSKILETQSK